VIHWCASARHASDATSTENSSAMGEA
jgi:hypothetical protein